MSKTLGQVFKVEAKESWLGSGQLNLVLGYDELVPRASHGKGDPEVGG